MDLSERLEAALAEHGPSDSAHDLAHARRVRSLAWRIAEGEGLTPGPALLAACYLHDLVSLPKDHPERAQSSRLSGEAARPIMIDLGLSQGQIEIAVHAIEAHSFSGGIRPETPEARVLQDADRIEALGAIGLARVFAVSGALGRQLWHPDDPFARERELDDTDWALDHFKVKLLKLPDTMTTTTGRAIATDRAGVLTRYLDDLAAELGEP